MTKGGSCEGEVRGESQCSHTVQPIDHDTSIEIFGAKKDVTDARNNIEKQLLSNKPSVWERQKKNTELFVVANGSVEYSSIVSKFMLTMTNATILTVQRIQNQFLWEKFIHHKCMIELKNGLEANEMELFHGTSDTFPEQIYDSEEWFDM